MIMYTSVAEQWKQVARQDFEKLHRSSAVDSLWSTISGRPHRLLRLNTVEGNGRYRSRTDTGIQTVSIAQICGSESRSTDFDRQWRPRKTVNRERWMGIAIAHRKDVPLPAVDLIKIGDAFFVRDGHHRISVAKHQGQVEIEANVIEWNLDDQPGMSVHAVTDAGSPFHMQFNAESWRRPLAVVQKKLFAFVRALERRLAPDMSNLFGWLKSASMVQSSESLRTSLRSR